MWLAELFFLTEKHNRVVRGFACTRRLAGWKSEGAGTAAASLPSWGSMSSHEAAALPGAQPGHRAGSCLRPCCPTSGMAEPCGLIPGHPARGGYRGRPGIRVSGHRGRGAARCALAAAPHKYLGSRSCPKHLICRF